MSTELLPGEKKQHAQMIEMLDHLYYVHMITHKADFLDEIRNAANEQEKESLRQVIFELDEIARKIDRLQAEYGVEQPSYLRLPLDAAYVLEELPAEMEKPLTKMIQIAHRNSVAVPEEIEKELGAEHFGIPQVEVE